VYPVIFIDCVQVKIREGNVANRPIYVALAVTVEGHRDILGLWAGEHGDGEGAKYWMRVLSEIKNRGTQDCLIMVCDGLKGLPEAIAAVWPQTIVQTCLVHYADLQIMPMSALNALVVAVPTGNEVGIIADSPERSAGGRDTSGAPGAYADATCAYVLLIAVEESLQVDGVVRSKRSCGLFLPPHPHDHDPTDDASGYAASIMPTKRCRAPALISADRLDIGITTMSA
jgi:hypothetical protein